MSSSGAAPNNIRGSVMLLCYIGTLDFVTLLCYELYVINL